MAIFGGLNWLLAASNGQIQKCSLRLSGIRRLVESNSDREIRKVKEVWRSRLTKVYLRSFMVA